MGSTSEQDKAAFDRWFPENKHPELYRHFTDEQRMDLFDEDLVAGRVVPRLLTVIILIGVTLAVGAVLFVL